MDLAMPLVYVIAVAPSALLLAAWWLRKELDAARLSDDEERIFDE